VTDTEVIVDLAAFRANLAALTEVVFGSEVMVVVKDDAYGHGLVELAREAEAAGVGWIGALDIPTGVLLRSHDIRMSLFSWLLDPTDDYSAAVGADLDLGVSRLSELEAIAAASAGLGTRVHLKVDTGLNRNGATATEWPVLLERAKQLQDEGAVEIIGLWTHIAEASDDEDSLSIARFRNAIEVARSLGIEAPLHHLAASAAGYGRPDARFDLVRFGAFAFGIPPGGGPSAREMGLAQTMTLRSTVARVSRDMDGNGFGLIPLGFGDGISTKAGGVCDVTIGGKRFQILEPIEIDRMWVALGGASVTVGDEVVLWGPGDAGEATVQEWADATGTMGEELVVRLNRHIPRRYLNGL
jgi:alanine racemase